MYITEILYGNFSNSAPAISPAASDFYSCALTFIRNRIKIYHIYAKKCNLSDSALWLFYSLYESSEPLTQTALCAAWHYPPQTINSLLKKMERQGYLVLAPASGSQKTKVILLTRQGQKLMDDVISPLILAENRALQNLTGEEQRALLELTGKYSACLQKEIH
ncbi:MAG TPA: MarR family winged helix-turn-helix transcriptional regulator [Candidatus Mediterraneibacter merdigallinarum]|nr:MarR family winged helix-turn-helix transcriptional regulator [Candidatus Mediterraneibacter merdigallinarum]